MIKIQKKDFNLDKELLRIKKKHNSIGAVSTFIGYVRDLNKNIKVKSIELEVYEKMAHKSLEKICLSAKKKWSLIDYLVIHRFGKLRVSEKIVLVATFSERRKNSAESCIYIMDYLKKNAPFWKKENYKNKSDWLVND